jgi:hypothetical protein
MAAERELQRDQSFRAHPSKPSRNGEQSPATYEQGSAARRSHREQPMASKGPEGEVTGKQNGPQHPCNQCDGGRRSPEQSLMQNGSGTQDCCRMKQQSRRTSQSGAGRGAAHSRPAGATSAKSHMASNEIRLGGPSIGTAVTSPKRLKDQECLLPDPKLPTRPNPPLGLHDAVSILHDSKNIMTTFPPQRRSLPSILEPGGSGVDRAL